MDPEVFSCLPTNVQRELLQEHVEVARTREALAHPGERTLTPHAQPSLRTTTIQQPTERTRAEQRIQVAMRCWDNHTHLEAVRSTPALKGVSDLRSLRGRIQQWVHAFAGVGPREGDVMHILKFCQSLLGAFQLDVIQGVLQWWAHLLSSRWPQPPSASLASSISKLSASQGTQDADASAFSEQGVLAPASDGSPTHGVLASASTTSGKGNSHDVVLAPASASGNSGVAMSSGPVSSGRSEVHDAAPPDDGPGHGWWVAYEFVRQTVDEWIQTHLGAKLRF